MTFSEGQLVRHLVRPEWGAGKVLKVQGKYLHVFFEERPGIEAAMLSASKSNLKAAEEGTHPWLDNLPPFKEVNGRLVLDEGRLTPKQAWAKFVGIFPDGFEDEAYWAQERDYKLKAHDGWQRELGDGQLEGLLAENAIEEAVVRARRVAGPLNLLSIYESAALADGLKDLTAARGFFEALSGLISRPAPDEETFTALVRAAGILPEPKGRVLTWPVVTLFPFVADPGRFMFLKPTITKEASARHAYELNYSAVPNWRTYASCLGLAATLMDALGPHGARDLIDVQSFIWVVSQYEEPKLSAG